MSDGNEIEPGVFNDKQLAYFGYIESQDALRSASSIEIALGAELRGIDAELELAQEEREAADSTFRQSLVDVYEAIQGDESLDPLERYVWSASFAWAVGEKSVTSDTDIVAFATGFQERVEAIQDRLIKGAPFIAVDWKSDNTVVAGVLQGDRFQIDDGGVKAPEMNGIAGWAGWGPYDWYRFKPNPRAALTLFAASWLKDSSPLDDEGPGLDILGGWDDQPGFAREQKVFIGVDEIKGFLCNTDREVKERFHGLLAAGMAGIDIEELEEELPEDVIKYRDEAAAGAARGIATTILIEAIHQVSDLRSSAEHIKPVEMPKSEDLDLYLKSIGIKGARLVSRVQDQLENIGQKDGVLKLVIPQVLPEDQLNLKVAQFFEKNTEELASVG